MSGIISGRLLGVPTAGDICCCGGNCGCGSGCNCASGFGGCKMYPDVIEEKSTTTKTTVMGVVAPQKGRLQEMDEMAAGSENGGCKCGSNCTCDPCKCK